MALRERLYDKTLFFKLDKMTENIIKNKGDFILEKVLITKSGIYSYGNKREYHHPNAFNQKFIKSIYNSPVILEHPKNYEGNFFFLGKKSPKRVGKILSIWKEIGKDNEVFIWGKLSITEKEVIKELVENEYGISLGYKKRTEDKVGYLKGEQYDQIASDFINDHIALTKTPRKEETMINNYDSSSANITNENSELEKKLLILEKRRKELEDENALLRKKSKESTEVGELDEKKKVLEVILPYVDKIERFFQQTTDDIKKKFLEEEMNLKEAKSFDSLKTDIAFKKAIDYRKDILEKQLSEKMGEEINSLSSFDQKGNIPSIFLNNGYDDKNNVLFVDPIMSGKAIVKEGKLIYKEGDNA